MEPQSDALVMQGDMRRGTFCMLHVIMEKLDRFDVRITGVLGYSSAVFALRLIEKNP
jgi:hypothetical protein